MIPLSTVKLLRAWARWGEAHNIDYPSMSPMFGERALKTPLFGPGHASPDILEMEAVVCKLEACDRELIILRWQRHLDFHQMGKRLRISRWTARRRLQDAESEVHRLLGR